GLIDSHPDLARPHVDGEPCGDLACRIVHHALAVARAILGRSSYSSAPPVTCTPGTSSPTTPTMTGTSAGASRPRPSSPRSASPSSTTPISPTAPAAPPGSTPSPGCPSSPPRGWSAPDEPQTVRHARRPPDRIRLAPPAGAGQRRGRPMTETPQIPHALHLAMAEWGRHHARLRDIDAETAAIDEQLAQLQQALADLSGRHADLGRQRHDAQ